MVEGTLLRKPIVFLGEYIIRLREPLQGRGPELTRCCIRDSTILCKELTQQVMW